MSIRAYLRTFLLTAIMLGTLGFQQSLMAATQGGTAVGMSTGSLDVAVTTGLVVRVSGFNDINLGAWSGAGGMSGSDNVCVGRSGVSFFGQGAYRVRLDGDGDAGDVNAFTLSNGTDLLYYDVMFNDATGAAGQVPVTGGVMLNGQTGSGFSQIFNLLFGCAVTNANIAITLSEAQLIAVPAGVYTGTLTLVLIPE